MRLLWTLTKVVLALAIAIPVSVIVLVTAFGLLGILFGLAVLVLKVAIAALIAVGLFKLVGHLVRGPAKRPAPSAQLPPVDPHYEAAMRELDRELGESPRR